MSIIKFKKYKTLESQIRRVVSLRIAFCVLLLTIAVFVSSVFDFLSALEQTKTSLKTQAHMLNDYIVAQVLIDNTDAIDAKLKSVEKQLPGVDFEWIQTKKALSEPKMRWIFPYYWQYDYPISDRDGVLYGKIQICGSYFYNNEILKHLLIKLFLLLFFSVSIFIVLKPLSKKIPQKLFINPILSILDLLKNKSSEKNISDLPYELQNIQDEIHDLLEKASKQSKIVAQENIAIQVAHDIRSPLLVLTRILKSLTALPERKRIEVRNAIQRVTDIANNLLSEYKNNDKKIEISSEPVFIMLDSIISEKRIETDGLSIDIQLKISDNTYGVFVQVNKTDFKRVISNLINNSIEAVRNRRGEINASLERINNEVLIRVNDNGCGIPKDKLKSVLEGASIGKNEGSGLGLPYAVRKILQWSGRYILNSQLNIGTTFEFVLPESNPADWFLESIKVARGSTIAILDDDEYIHKIWGDRFPDNFLKANALSILNYYNIDDFVKYYDKTNINNTFFLLDYDIGGNQDTGLTLVKSYDLGKYAALVTSRYEDDEVRESCRALGMKIIPKFFAEHIPIEILSEKSTLNEPIVFIDDDEVITSIWEESAKNAKRSLDIYHDPNDFAKVIHLYPKHTLIYIDSSLGGGVKGEAFSRVLYEKGFTNLILATGYPKSSLKHVTWVKDIIQKNPPWD